MNRIVKTLALAGPILSAALLSQSPADACGGCFVPPSTSTVVTGHRMALSVSAKRTVLWDQIQYQGDPEDFSWVLPIKPGARIELADNAWFEALEAATTTVVQAPQLNCGNGGTSPFGCGASGALGGGEALADGAGAGGGVQVIKQETIGPYEAATLGAEDPEELTNWLFDHGYDIPDEVKPIIGAYVEEGFHFIALQLVPGNGVNLMKPVRVITDGASPVLPLRMVSAGTGPLTSIILYVIGEGRWTTANFMEATVSYKDLKWYGDKNDSNYAALRQAAMGLDGGRAWIATYAQGDALFGYWEEGWGGGGIAYSYNQTLVDESGNNWDTVSDCNKKMSSAVAGGSIVVDPCDPVSGECGAVGDGEIDARDLACGELTDVATALVGMHPDDVWVTRLEANLPRYALGTDLQLKAHEKQTTQSSYHVAEKSENYQCPAAPPTGSSPKAPPGNGTALLVVGLGALAALLAARRRRGFVGA